MIISRKSCRLCLRKCPKQDLLHLFSKESRKQKLLETIAILTGSLLEPIKNIPKSVCKDCVAKLKNIQEFKELCKESENYLLTVRSIYEANGEKTGAPTEEESIAILDSEEEILGNNNSGTLDIQQQEYLPDNEFTEPPLTQEYKQEEEISIADCLEVQINSHSFSDQEEAREETPTDQRLDCDYCGVSLIREVLEFHIRSHARHRFMCELCINSFYFNKNSLKTHLLTKHYNDQGLERALKKLNINPRKSRNIKKPPTKKTTRKPSQITLQVCNKCFAICQDKKKLKIHKKVCPGKSFPCPKCSQLFKSRSLLRKHAIEHQGDTLKCSNCQKVFMSGEMFQLHKIYCLGNHSKFNNSKPAKRKSLLKPMKVFKCMLCNNDEEFVYSHQYQDHMELHASGKIMVSVSSSNSEV